MLMMHPEHGWHDADETEIEGLKKAGWTNGEDEHRRIINAKKGNTETPIQVKRKPGRKPKNPC